MTDNRAPTLPIEDRLIGLHEVSQITGLSARTIYRRIRQGSFPAQYKPGGFSSRWSGREVLDWKEAMMAGRAV